MPYHRSIIQLNAVRGGLDLSEALPWDLFTHWHDTNQMATQWVLGIAAVSMCGGESQDIAGCGAGCWLELQYFLCPLWNCFVCLFQFSSPGVQTLIYKTQMQYRKGSHYRHGQTKNVSVFLLSAVPRIFLRESTFIYFGPVSSQTSPKEYLPTHMLLRFITVFSQPLSHISSNHAPLSRKLQKVIHHAGLYKPPKLNTFSVSNVAVRWHTETIEHADQIDC